MAHLIPRAADDDKVLIVGAAERGLAHGAQRVQKTVGELKSEYQRVVGQIIAMTEDTPDDGALALTTVQVGLGFTADGELGFVAKASADVDATISLTFSRTGGSAATS